MRFLSFFRPAVLPALVLPLVLILATSGCTLLGLGAAAGATVGGCALLDTNDDAVVTEEELSAGLHEAWDTNADGALTEAEFDAGVSTRAIFADWSGSFNDWDTDEDGTLTEAEFSSGAARSDSADWLDARCDDLGL